MIRSILLALDDTPGAVAARDVAFALARRTGASLTAVIVLDRPHTTGAAEPTPVGAGAFALRRNVKLAAAVEAEAAAVLAAARDAARDLAFDVVRREEAPEEALLAESATHDLIIIGRDCTLGREEADEGLSPTIEALLKDGVRPLLVVPEGTRLEVVPEGTRLEVVPEGTRVEALPDGEGVVLMGHDGSLAAMRTLQLFALLGLAEGARVKLLDFTTATPPEALQCYLTRHGMKAEAYAVEGDAHDILLAEARSLPAAMLVLGAEQEGGITRLIFGSAIGRLLRNAPCPVFIQG